MFLHIFEMLFDCYISLIIYACSKTIFREIYCFCNKKGVKFDLILEKLNNAAVKQFLATKPKIDVVVFNFQ
jgi:hypothetical protein